MRASDVSAAFVRDLQHRGRSWSHIARMAGCSEMDLRERFGDLPPGTVGSRATARVDADAVARWVGYCGFTRAFALALARIYAAGDREPSIKELVVGLDIAPFRADRRFLAAVRRAGVYRLKLRFSPYGLNMTLDSRREVERRVRAWMARSAAA